MSADLQKQIDVLTSAVISLTEMMGARITRAQMLENLRDYCTARLAARQEAKATDGLSIHRGNVFSIEHANLFQPLN